MQPWSTARYHQRTGQFSIFAPVDDSPNERVLSEFFGYAGRGPGRNNPDMAAVRNTGPLPCGLYWVREERHPKFRAPAFRLTPYAGNEMHGRSGFLIHGDNAASDASQGCIVLHPVDREKVAMFRVRVLEVVAK